MKANSEKELIALAQEGNKDALERLLKLHEAYIYKLILGHSVPYEECDSMFNYCVIGVINALKHFDVNRNVRFLSYATGYILESIEIGMTETFFKVKLPKSSTKSYFRAKKIKDSKTNKEFDEYLRNEGIFSTYKNVENIYESEKIDDVYVPVEADENKSMENTLCNKIYLDTFINQLTTDQQKVIRYFYYEDKNINEITKLLNLKKYQVDYLKSSALKTLKSLIKEHV